MVALFIAISLLTAPPPCRNDGHNQRRSSTALRVFKKAHPCPGGPNKGSTTRCKGYVIDHICALACCGKDDPSNMQWQTLAESKKKDRTELQCHECKSRSYKPGGGHVEVP